MNIGDNYIQYSKVFTFALLISCVAQTIATIVLVCLYPDSSSALIEIFKTSTGLVGLCFGCYAGNSAVEKVSLNKKAVDTLLSQKDTASG